MTGSEAVDAERGSEHSPLRLNRVVGCTLVRGLASRLPFPPPRRLKTLSSGYASFDYEPHGEQPADVVPLGLHVNKRPVGALTRIVRSSKATDFGRAMVQTLKEEMDRTVHDIVIQATVGSRVVARETVRAVRKNVLAKCYGGDISRKKKLLEKQKAGKKRASLHVGDVAIPHEAFVKVLAPSSRKKR